VTGNHHEEIAYTIKAVTESRRSHKVRRKVDAREIAHVLAIRHHRLKQIELNDTAKTNVTARACEL